MKNQFIQHLESLAPNFKKAHFLLAVSGGIDSCVMTHLFQVHQLNYDMAHCNFQLRGEDSDLDMQFVESELIRFLVKDHQKKPEVFVKIFDTRSEQINSGNSIEMVARELRYSWFKQLSSKYDFVCTAHHANDNAETILLNLVRGTGYKGLNGIPEVNQPYIRPMLQFTSDQIHKYAKENHVPFRVDLSNLTNEFSRNKIRNSVIPILEELNPNLIQTFQKNSRLFIKQYQFYKEQILKIKKRILQQDQLFYKIEIEQILSEQNREIVLYELLNDFNFNYSTVNQLNEQLLGESGKFFYSSTHCLVKDRTTLFIYPKEQNDQNHEVIISNDANFKNADITATIIPNRSDFIFEKKSNIAYFDADLIEFPLLIRHWKEGDYFHPYGMKGKKKLSDLFVDLKLNIIQKQQIQILCDPKKQNQIMWVIGLRTSDLYKVNSKTKKILILKRNVL